jgi:hypothetical protein
MNQEITINELVARGHAALKSYRENEHRRASELAEFGRQLKKRFDHFESHPTELEGKNPLNLSQGVDHVEAESSRSKRS